jgi:hypothetical protein
MEATTALFRFTREALGVLLHGFGSGCCNTDACMHADFKKNQPISPVPSVRFRLYASKGGGSPVSRLVLILCMRRRVVPWYLDALQNE